MVLIVGGYGTFGGRLARLLADEPRLTLVIAGRSAEKAARFCAGLAAAATLRAAAFDRDGDPGAQLAALGADVVVDATGPFQTYGADPYRLVRACLASGAHYLDLADGSDFVTGIAAFDAEAKARGLYALAGVSSFPALTAAVVRHLARDYRRVERITGGVAPSPYARVGLNVIRAVAAYAGQPVRIRRDGAWGRAYPLTETCRDTIAPPGRLPLHSTLFSLVDVPDLTLLQGVCPEVRSIWIGAGPVPASLHRCLIALAWLVRWRAIPSIAGLAPLFLPVLNRLRWGEHRGGLVVEIEGIDLAGEARTSSWHLVAEGDDGPLIPSMAIEAVLRAHLDGRRPSPGARPATDALDMGDVDRVFARHAIATGLRRAAASDAGRPLYPRLLDSAWRDLPPAVRAMHALEGSATAEGRASVERGRNPLARLVASLFRFPPAAADIPVTVRFEVTGAGEVWRRQFGSHRFLSHHAVKDGRWRHLLCERFGPFTFGIALVVDDGLHFIVRRWALGPLPLPLWLAPTSRAWESAADGRFAFDVDLGHPLLGRIVRYRGWLGPPRPEGAGAKGDAARFPLGTLDELSALIAPAG